MALGWTTIADFVTGARFAFQDANEMKGNSQAAEAEPRVYPLGGSRQTALSLIASGQNALDYLDVELLGVTGFTYRARVEVRAGAATNVTPKIRNVTDASDAVVGTLCSGQASDYSGADQVQTLTFTPVIGALKKYRLQATPSNTTNGVYCIGVLERLPTSL